MMTRLKKRVVLEYFSLWARIVLRLRRPRIVGITGSVGKTTTREVIAAVLSHPEARPIVGTVGKTPGNMNDNSGLPLAVLGYLDYPNSRAEVLSYIVSVPFHAAAALFGRCPDVLVLEYSASSDGDIPRLAKLARPTVAVVTAIGPAHLEVFGSVERIAEVKGALVRAVPRGGLVVLGPDNPYADQMARQSAAPVTRVRGLGRALSDDIAREVGRYFGVLDETIARAIRDVPAVRHRLEFRTAGAVRVIDDSVNANPLSMTLGLETLRHHAAPGQRTVALLGFMAELGPDAPRYHQQVGALARERADVTVGVGPLARHYGAERWFESVKECIDALPGILRPGDLVFVKGSSASGMKVVATAIEEMAVTSRQM